MRPVTNVKTIADVAAMLDPKPLFIADGHHRYETACNYRDWLAEQGPLDANHPSNFVLTQCVSMNDPGLLVLATHRLFRGVKPMTSAALQSQLGASFETHTVGRGANLAASLWEDLEMAGEQGRLAFYTAEDDTWTGAAITPAGEARIGEMASEQSTDWQSLGVSILHRLVMESLLEYTE